MKKRNLGRQQKAMGSTEIPPEEPREQAAHDWDSDLAIDLLKQWAWYLSSSQVQHLSADSYNDQLKILKKAGVSTEYASKTLKQLAELGNHGKNGGSVKRDLLAFLGDPVCARPVYDTVPCLTGKLVENRDEVADVSMPFLAPHYVLSHLFHNCRARFDSLLLGEDADATTLPKFWSTVVTRKDPRIIRHPMCKKKDWQHLMIPIMLHGDAVPAVGVGKSHSKSFDTYSWQSLFALGSSILEKKLTL